MKYKIIFQDDEGRRFHYEVSQKTFMFIDDLLINQLAYHSGSYTRAEEYNQKLKEMLDDIITDHIERNEK